MGGRQGTTYNTVRRKGSRRNKWAVEIMLRFGHRLEGLTAANPPEKQEPG
jgi:hypothetical protein